MAPIKVTLKRSLNGANQKQKQSARCLGFKKLNQSRLLIDSPVVRGQIKAIRHMLSVEEV